MSMPKSFNNNLVTLFAAAATLFAASNKAKAGFGFSFQLGGDSPPPVFVDPGPPPPPLDTAVVQFVPVIDVTGRHVSFGVSPVVYANPDPPPTIVYAPPPPPPPPNVVYVSPSQPQNVGYGSSLPQSIPAVGPGSSISPEAVAIVAQGTGVQIPFYWAQRGFSSGFVTETGQSVGLQFELENNQARVIRVYDLSNRAYADQYRDDMYAASLLNDSLAHRGIAFENLGYSYPYGYMGWDTCCSTFIGFGFSISFDRDPYCRQRYGRVLPHAIGVEREDQYRARHSDPRYQQHFHVEQPREPNIIPGRQTGNEPARFIAVPPPFHAQEQFHGTIQYRVQGQGSVESTQFREQGQNYVRPAAPNPTAPSRLAPPANTQKNTHH